MIAHDARFSSRGHDKPPVHHNLADRWPRILPDTHHLPVLRHVEEEDKMIEVEWPYMFCFHCLIIIGSYYTLPLLISYGY